MPTIEQLLDLRPVIEEDFRNAFIAQDINAFTRQNAPANFRLQRPRVEIKAKIGAATGHRFVCPDGGLRYDVWMFSLAIMCVTTPQNGDSAENLQQNQYVANVRQLTSILAQGSWGDEINFPNHYIAEPLKDMGTDENLKTDDNIEYSVLSFDGKIAVRQEVWPAGGLTPGGIQPVLPPVPAQLPGYGFITLIDSVTGKPVIVTVANNVLTTNQ
jgi:hypothetical protein